MAEQAGTNSKLFDEMNPWRNVRNAYLEAWAKAMVDVVNNEAYAQATGAFLDSYLTVSAPFSEAMEKIMVKTLEQLAMPSRADVLSIAERMTNIEMRLDDLDAKLDEIRGLNHNPDARQSVPNGRKRKGPKSNGAKKSPGRRTK